MLSIIEAWFEAPDSKTLLAEDSDRRVVGSIATGDLYTLVKTAKSKFIGLGVNSVDSIAVVPACLICNGALRPLS